MLKIVPGELTEFAETLHGKQLHTITALKPFTVEVVGGLLSFTNSKNNERDHGGKNLQAVLDRFNKTKSLKTGDYKHDTINASYVLALIALYLAARVSGTTGQPEDDTDD